MMLIDSRCGFPVPHTTPNLRQYIITAVLTMALGDQALSQFHILGRIAGILAQQSTSETATVIL
jgi:hypothetical protein